MLHRDFPYPLYLVVSEKDCIHHPILSVVEQAIQGGVDIVQLREKDCDFDSYLEKAIAVKQICDANNIPLIINDNVEVARTVNAWGVHVGTSDMPPSEIAKLANAPQHIGWSLEQIEQLESPQMQFVHHLGVSPVYSTPTKTNTITEWGLEGIREIRSKIDLPLIAIGGINEKNIQKIIRAGAHSIAVVSAIAGSEDPFHAAAQLKKLINEVL